MKRSLTIITSVLILMLAFNNLNAQLSEQLKGITKFSEIQAITEAYYAKLKKEGKEIHYSDPKYKHWKRWEYDMQLEQMPSGELAKNKLALLKADKHIKKMDQSVDRNTLSNWTYAGPDGSVADPTSTHFIGIGRVNRMAFHPTNENIIYIGGPAGGLWKTIDGGNTWNVLDDYLPSLGISGIVVSHENPQVVYALSGDGDGGGYFFSSGVFKSTNGGATWIAQDLGIDTTYAGFTLEMDPNDANHLLAATTEGLYRTTDGGNNWTKKRNGKIYDVKFKPGSSDKVYIATDFTILKYNNINTSYWDDPTITPIIQLKGRKALAVTPADPSRVYAFIGPNLPNNTYQGFYISQNEGESFLRVHDSPNTPGGQTTYNFCAAASPINKNTVITCGLNAWKTVNGGVHFSQITHYRYTDSISWYVHPDFHDIAFNPLNNKLYAATDGGFYVSENQGQTWSDLSAGLGLAQYYRIDVTPEDEHYVVGGLQDNGLKIRKSNSILHDHILGTDGFDVKFYNGDKSKYIVSTSGSTKRFADDGNIEVNFLSLPLGFSKLAIKPDDNNTMVVASSNFNGKLYKSTNEGVSFDSINLLAGNALESCPSNNNRLYLAGPKKMYISNDFGSSVEEISSNPEFPAASEFPSISDIAVHPLNSNFVCASFGGYEFPTGVVMSTNAGTTWTNITGSLPDIPIRCITVAVNGDIYVGANIGIFLRKAGSTDWIPYRNGLPNVVINDLAIEHGSGTLYAGTFGRGIWKAPISPSACLESLTFSPSVTHSGFKYYEAQNNITSSGQVFGEFTSNVFFQAGNSVTLLPGAHIKQGSNFKALIGPCGTGIPDIKDKNGESVDR
ncbi:3-coathanger stack domain-containing protein [Portibacter lacus]|nr:3-coathanger stack domain-containing protein [Portibacter lacus]